MFDAYLDLEDRLEHALLEREEPPSHATARQQLTAAGIKVQRVIATRPEAVLFVNEFGKAMTAWSEVRASEAVVFYCVAGFPAENAA